MLGTISFRERNAMSLEFVPVRTPEDIKDLAELAKEIWFEYWPALIGEDQTEYMVRKFQSEEAITRDMAENGYEYWFLRSKEDETPAELEDGYAQQERIVGFTGGHDEPETNRFFISKIYLLKAERGKHYASEVIRFYERLCEDRGFDAMYLTVNKGNELGTRAYKAKGFTTIDEVETDIGEGFIMDDYIMEKKVS